jgi:hypothetical protein
MLKRLRVPSGTTNQSDQRTSEFLHEADENTSRVWLVEKWRQGINKKQERRLMDIVESFDLNAYGYGNSMPSEEFWVR